MSIEITFRPLQKWPGTATPGYKRERSRFSAKYRDTLALLDRELRHLKAKSVVIQLDCDEREIRKDGLPRSDARTRGPGVVLSFESPKGALSFPCDRFTAWEDNLRAIALALDALRTVDRYHVTQHNEQYRGWSALSDHTAPPAFTNRQAAITWLVETGAIDGGRNYPAEEVRRRAIAKYHPDRPAGDDRLWRRWLQAAAVLGVEV